MDYSLLKAIIGHVEAYQAENSSMEIGDFTIWLNHQLFSSQETSHESDAHSPQDELLIPFKLMHLNKALKKQTKEALSESNVSSIDEYSFLLHLDYQESFRKMEIVELHNLEPPTGIEIIKRLLRNQFIEEFPDQEDKRARRIRITGKGRNELESIKPKMDTIFGRFSDPLSLHQKIQLSGLLNQLIG